MKVVSGAGRKVHVVIGRHLDAARRQRLPNTGDHIIAIFEDFDDAYEHSQKEVHWRSYESVRVESLRVRPTGR